MHQYVCYLTCAAGTMIALKDHNQSFKSQQINRRSRIWDGWDLGSRVGGSQNPITTSRSRSHSPTYICTVRRHQSILPHTGPLLVVTVGRFLNSGGVFVVFLCWWKRWKSTRWKKVEKWFLKCVRFMIKWLAKWVKFPQHILEVVSCYIFSSSSRCRNWWGRASSPSCLLYAVLAILHVILKDIPWPTASDITVVTVKKCATSIKHVNVFCNGFKRRCYSVMTHTKCNTHTAYMYVIPNSTYVSRNIHLHEYL